MSRQFKAFALARRVGMEDEEYHIAPQGVNTLCRAHVTSYEFAPEPAEVRRVGVCQECRDILGDDVTALADMLEDAPREESDE